MCAYNEEPDNNTRLAECKECGKEFPRDEMQFSRDCHGIPFRLLCFDCYDKIMDEKGYDGEEYTSDDENIEEDW